LHCARFPTKQTNLEFVPFFVGHVAKTYSSSLIEEKYFPLYHKLQVELETVNGAGKGEENQRETSFAFVYYRCHLARGV
jgi:hypothetical protein